MCADHQQGLGKIHSDHGEDRPALSRRPHARPARRRHRLRHRPGHGHEDRDLPGPPDEADRERLRRRGRHVRHRRRSHARVVRLGAVTQCPTLDGSACSMAITNCDHLITCLACLDDHAVRQTMTQAAGSANAAAFGSSSPVNRCQRMIGKATAKYAGSTAKALSKCWEARLRGHHSNPCPAPGDGRAVAALAKAEAKKVKAICGRCGGADKTCNGTGDLAVADIGFSATCRAVTVPGGASCAGGVATLSDLVDCVDCVAMFEDRCADAAAVPGVTAYPPNVAAAARPPRRPDRPPPRRRHCRRSARSSTSRPGSPAVSAVTRSVTRQARRSSRTSRAAV